LSRPSILRAFTATLIVAAIYIFLWFFMFALIMFTTPAYPHEHYGGVYEKNDREVGNKLPCCGDDPLTGDCEALTWDQIEAMPNGDVLITSKRYGTVVKVSAPKIFWGIMMDLRRSPPEPASPGDPYAGHWCGKPRAKMAYNGDVFNETQVDMAFWTFCIFLKSGGV
jgi:hypothetical protein